MKLYDRLPAAGIRSICHAMAYLIPHIPDSNVVSISRKVLGTHRWPEGNEILEKLLLMFKRQLKHCCPKSREKAAKNLLANMIIIGQRRRCHISATLGFDIPLLLVISPTMRCPLKCYGCYSAQYTTQEDLDFEVFDRIISDAKQLGIYFIVVSGGEPFVYPRIMEIYERHNDVWFQVYTNGVSLAQKENVLALAKLGNVFPCISLEGFEEQTDRRRGKGHFKKILSAMAHLREAGVPFGFSATATRENSETIVSDEFIDFFIDQGCLLGWIFQYLPIGRKPDLSLIPIPEQRVHRRRRVLEIRRTKPLLIADFWNDGPAVGGCIAGGRRYLHINNKGDVEPCVFAHFATDNIYKKPLLDIIKDSPLYREIRKRQPYSENLLKPCMIIDNPQVLREVVQISGAFPTEENAEQILNELAPEIDRLASSYGKVADELWNSCRRVQ
jgi:MoaA/NifB/PqqE/SkfB family radical SAM enzyme